MGHTRKALVLAFVGLSCAEGLDAKAETVASILAAQIRTQGFACDRAQQAKRDARLSKADYEVWVLKCGNATYRIGRYPDRAAQVEILR
jgi:hypothetical protein